MNFGVGRVVEKAERVFDPPRQFNFQGCVRSRIGTVCWFVWRGNGCVLSAYRQGCKQRQCGRQDQERSQSAPTRPGCDAGAVGTLRTLQMPSPLIRGKPEQTPELAMIPVARLPHTAATVITGRIYGLTGRQCGASGLRECAPGRPDIELARAADALFGILDHFLPLRDPADRARNCKQHREHIDREADCAQCDA